MRWETGRRSSNVEDRRGLVVRRGGAIGSAGVLIAIVAALLGAPPGLVRDLLSGAGSSTTTTEERPYQASPEEQQRAEFVSVVLADTEDTWRALFRSAGRAYEDPRLVLFSEAVESACGLATSAVGPFYCPPERKVFLDLSFFSELDRRFGAPGDFAQAYVVAHEVGHHVQTLIGVSERVHAARARLSEVEGNALQVKMELQADCLAGVWGHHAQRARNLLESGDVEEALRAAAAIGDDTLQKKARGRVAPETFTHGSAAQRVSWFRRGLEAGTLEACDTFGRGAL